MSLAGREISNLMHRAGLTDADVASALKMSSSQVFLWRKSQSPIHPIDMDCIRKLCGEPTPFLDSIRPRERP